MEQGDLVQIRLITWSCSRPCQWLSATERSPPLTPQSIRVIMLHLTGYTHEVTDTPMADVRSKCVHADQGSVRVLLRRSVGCDRWLTDRTKELTKDLWWRIRVALRLICRPEPCGGTSPPNPWELYVRTFPIIKSQLYTWGTTITYYSSDKKISIWSRCNWQSSLGQPI